jgi:hypothetical protein
MERQEEKLTPKQIENWRRILCMMIGPYALMMTDEQIQQYRDQMQKKLEATSNVRA